MSANILLNDCLSFLALFGLFSFFYCPHELANSFASKKKQKSSALKCVILEEAEGSPIK
jgi:hypothetical protein